MYCTGGQFHYRPCHRVCIYPFSSTSRWCKNPFPSELAHEWEHAPPLLYVIPLSNGHHLNSTSAIQDILFVSPGQNYGSWTKMFASWPSLSGLFFFHKFLGKFYIQGEKKLGILFIYLSNISSGSEVTRLDRVDCFFKKEPSLKAGSVGLLAFWVLFQSHIVCGNAKALISC